MADEKKSFDLFDLCFVDTASSTDDGCPTPSTTMSANMPIREKGDVNLGNSDSKHEKPKETKPAYDNHARHLEHPPIPHELCMIRTREKPHRFLSLFCGELGLSEHPVFANGMFWYCREKDNWCGFRNLTSGAFLGHDKTGKIVATKSHHGLEEYFIPIRQPEGGYILHTFHHQKTELWQVRAIEEDKIGSCLIEVREGGTTWDFVSAKYMRLSINGTCPGMEEDYVVKLVDRAD